MTEEILEMMEESRKKYLVEYKKKSEKLNRKKMMIFNRYSGEIFQKQYNDR